MEESLKPAKNWVKDWSWGAFILDPFFLIAIRRYIFLLLYLLYFIPGINFIAVIGIKIYLGLKGKELAEHSPTFSSAEERKGFFKAIDHAGLITFIIALVIMVLSFIFGAIVAAFFAKFIGAGLGQGMMLRGGGMY